MTNFFQIKALFYQRKDFKNVQNLNDENIHSSCFFAQENTLVWSKKI
jgi:hypothetical protein